MLEGIITALNRAANKIFHLPISFMSVDLEVEVIVIKFLFIPGEISKPALSRLRDSDSVL